MAAKYKEYLAVNVLNEGQIVSYRSLSRALKVHVNAAKEMLYDFHRQQNARKPGSVHATYLITGARRAQDSLDINPSFGSNGGDSFMQSSPFTSSMPNHDSQKEDIDTVKTILVANEEDLDAAKARFEKITSIHIYTLEPNSIDDLQILTNCNREIASKFASEDPLESWKQYGTIQNPNVKRRARRGPPPAPAQISTTVAAKTEPRPLSVAMSKDHNGAVTKETETAPKPTKQSTSLNVSDKAELQVEETAAPAKKGIAKPPTLKRDASSFFKSATKANGKVKRENTGSSAASSVPSQRQSVEQSPVEDGEVPTTDALVNADQTESMKDASQDEGDDEVAVPSVKKDGAIPSETRKQREEVLRKMMDDDDQNMEDSPAAATDDPQDLNPPAPAQPEKEATPEETVTVAGGRRRGRRRVMKKKTMKDEEGYLVTKEEPVWESFSEDEPQPKKVKMPSAAVVTNKAKKTGSRPGQGNIMSFFAKK